MTRTTNARIAGVTFLIYIAAGIASLVLSDHARAGVPGHGEIYFAVGSSGLA